MQRPLKYAVLILMVVMHCLVPAWDESWTLPISGDHIFSAEFRAGYYYTDGNYMQNFSFQSLSQILKGEGGDRAFFDYMDAGFSMSYAPWSWFEASVFSTGIFFARSQNQTLNQAGFKVQRAGLAFRSHQRASDGLFGWIPELSLSFPFYSLNNQDIYPITDDGSIYFTPGFWLYGRVEKVFYPFVYTGFKWREDPFSSLLLWKAGAMLKAEIAELGAYYYGFWSVIKDQADPLYGDRFILLKRVNSASMKFASSNPNLIAGFKGWLAWHFPYLTLRIHGEMDINGAFYAKGYGFFASIIMKLGSNKPATVTDIFKQDSSVGFKPHKENEEEALSDIFSDPQESAKMLQEAEQLLEDASDDEERKMEAHEDDED